MVQIQNKFLSYSTYTRPGYKRSKTTKIAVHYTGDANAPGINVRNYFENSRFGPKSISSNYVIGLQGEIICCIPDEEIAWCTNQANSYSVSIETCHPKNDGAFTDATYISLCELCAMLLKKYKLGVNDLIRHYDVTGKQCPLHWVPTKYQKESIATARWNIFKRDVQTVMNGGKVTRNNTVDVTENNIPVSNKIPYIVRVIDPALNIRSGPGVNNKIVGCITNKGAYTIVEEKKVGSATWGKLKSGAGWINVGSAYVKKV